IKLPRRGNETIDKQNCMKNIKTLAVVAVGGLAICGFAIAQGHRAGALGHSAMQHRMDVDSVVEHLAEVFPRFAAFDANKDGQLDANERESLAKAVADGTVQLPAYMPPNEVEPSSERMISHIAEMYARFAQ